MNLFEQQTPRRLLIHVTYERYYVASHPWMKWKEEGMSIIHPHQEQSGFNYRHALTSDRQFCSVLYCCQPPTNERGCWRLFCASILVPFAAETLLPHPHSQNFSWFCCHFRRDSPFSLSVPVSLSPSVQISTFKQQPSPFPHSIHFCCFPGALLCRFGIEFPPLPEYNHPRPKLINSLSCRSYSLLVEAFIVVKYV